MVTLCKHCYPHCDFCIYSEYHYLELNKERVHVSVDGCKLHLDNHHQWLAKNLEYVKIFIVTKQIKIERRSFKLLFF